MEPRRGGGGEDRADAALDEDRQRGFWAAFGGLCEFGFFCLSVTRRTAYPLTRIPGRPALVRALIIIFAPPCRAVPCRLGQGQRPRTRRSRV
jgi:hypothetical protein